MERIIRGDVLRWAALYRGEKFHALFCDPPYHLTSIVQRFGKNGSKPAQYGKDGAFARASAGFMGQTWDGGDVAFQAETWEALGEHLLPGAFGVAFASSRGWHRVAVAIEDAGFILHPTIFGWSFGSGFPKATRIDTQVDREAGAERGVIGPSRRHGGGNNHQYAQDQWTKENHSTMGTVETAPATPLAKVWEGHRYGLQAMKPALEPILLFQKPYQGRPLDNIVQTGAGALNIEGCRLPVDPEDMNIRENSSEDHSRSRVVPFSDQAQRNPTLQQGRWPSNFILSHHPDCESGESGELVCHADCPVRKLDHQSGITVSTGGKPEHIHSMFFGDTSVTGQNAGGLGDSGGASRFFFTYQYDQFDQSDPVFYGGKSDTDERERGLRGHFPCRTCGNLHSRHHRATWKKRREDGSEEIIQTDELCRRNDHPTIKPLELTQWLSTLLLPPPEYRPRKILVPFAGTGSEMIGAFRGGWEVIIGIEMSPDYVQLAKKRLDYWRTIGVQQALL